MVFIIKLNTTSLATGEKLLELSSSPYPAFSLNRISVVGSLPNPLVTGSSLPSKASGEVLGQVTPSNPLLSVVQTMVPKKPIKMGRGCSSVA